VRVTPNAKATRNWPPLCWWQLGIERGALSRKSRSPQNQLNFPAQIQETQHLVVVTNSG
jgi:hypothetical protein